jgi:hypothetical protein
MLEFIVGVVGVFLRDSNTFLSYPRSPVLRFRSASLGLRTLVLRFLAGPD